MLANLFALAALLFMPWYEAIDRGALDRCKVSIVTFDREPVEASRPLAQPIDGTSSWPCSVASAKLVDHRGGPVAGGQLKLMFYAPPGPIERGVSYLLLSRSKDDRGDLVFDSGSAIAGIRMPDLSSAQEP
ncbi:MAG TPA: hypothetical protein VMI31_01990 [Fimbriimonadaceae bacterium]|nr:hypothetical protein [Fimbriimonadaceae bacterium]